MKGNYIIMLHEIIDRTSLFMESMPKTLRKSYGQFFTTELTARFMAGMFDIDITLPYIRICDAGAGTGVLTAAIVEHILNLGYTGHIHIVCYENDNHVLPLLRENLELIANGHQITYEIREYNYIIAPPVDGEKFDYIIGNPPYKKIGKDAPEALALPCVCHGAPNLYFLFWTRAIDALRDGQELVYIIPRSWTSGAYFAKFREYLFSKCVITSMHIFASRDKVFDGESVLQETMIIKLRKTVTKPEFVHMTASSSSAFDDLRHYDVPYSSVVAPNGYVFLVTSEEESLVLNRLNKLTDTLQTVSLAMHTGIVVDFRTREVLRDKAEEGSVPLFYSHHIRGGRVVWPAQQEGEYMVTDHKGFLQVNGNYVFVKRFTAKEEHRRLQCGILLATDYPEYKFIGTQNKINFIKCATAEEAYGIYTLLNSTLYDTYYRILNGSTQVNSTEVNSIPVPDVKTITAMGRQLMGHKLTEDNCNKIIRQWIS